MTQLSRDLNLIFWGVLIIIIDLSYSRTVNGFGNKFDLVNDLVGAIMIYVAVTRIAKLKITVPSYIKNMLLATVVAIIQFFYALMDFVIFEHSAALEFILTILNIVIIWGSICFCKAMTDLSIEKLLSKSEKRWEQVRKLFFWVYLLPYAIITALGLISSATNNSWYVNLSLSVSPGAVMLLVVIFFIPLIFMLYTIYEMRQEINKVQEP